MNAIEVLDEAARRVRIGPGARWMDVAAALAPHGWALSSGDYGGVGVGGLATAGGIGWLVREHGLTIDHLRAVELVLADGSRRARASDARTRTCSGPSAAPARTSGIVTSFEFEVDEVGDVGFAQLVFDASDTAGFLQAWGDGWSTRPRDLTSFLIMGRPRPGQPTVAQVDGGGRLRRPRHGHRPAAADRRRRAAARADVRIRATRGDGQRRRRRARRRRASRSPGPG